MTTTGKQRTILQELIAAGDAGARPRFGVRSTVRVGRQLGIVVALDHGNDALKLAVLTPDGRLITLRIPTAYKEAELIRGGDNEISYSVEDGPAFWMGETALSHDGEDLPIGPTSQRIIDGRLRSMVAAALVEILHTAGYKPGTHNIILGFAIPNTEIVPIRGTGEGESERLGVDPATREALETHLKGAKWGVGRINTDGSVDTWQINVMTAVPQAQTTGTLVAVTKAATGSTVTDLDALDIIDVGGGDLQVTTVRVKPSYQMTTNRVGDGTIRVARALKGKFPKFDLNNVAAQQALMTRRLLVAGRQRDISAEVEDVLNSQGQGLIGAVLPVLRQSRRFVVITGGGVILLRDLIVPRLDAETKARGEDYELINHGLASVINAIGILFATILKAAQLAQAAANVEKRG